MSDRFRDGPVSTTGINLVDDSSFLSSLSLLVVVNPNARVRDRWTYTSKVDQIVRGDQSV